MQYIWFYISGFSPPILSRLSVNCCFWFWQPTSSETISWLLWSCFNMHSMHKTCRHVSQKASTFLCSCILHFAFLPLLAGPVYLTSYSMSSPSESSESADLDYCVMHVISFFRFEWISYSVLSCCLLRSVWCPSGSASRYWSGSIDMS